MSNTPKNHGQRWSPADDRALRELARQNTPTRVIGIKLGRSEDSVYGRASGIGLSLKPTNQRPNKGRRRS